MAPSAISPLASPTPTKSGLDLEQTSDLIDDVNVLKGTLAVKPSQTPSSPDPDSIYTGSTFDASKDKTQFRQYTTACSRVQKFYTEQHTKQTVSYNLLARNTFHASTNANLTIWEAMQKLDTLIDDSDPDTELSQIEHLLQAAEALRRDGKPRWMQLVGLIHDLGKLLYFFGARGQWDVVGDTFPVGCAFSPAIILPDTFAHNPDTNDAIYSTEHGIYTPGCGVDNLIMSWGHDEYLYQVLKRAEVKIPDEGLAMIRYHSFYAWHREGAYEWAMEERDYAMREAVRAFNPYDLYSKSDGVPDVVELKEYYTGIIDEFIGKDRKIQW